MPNLVDYDSEQAAIVNELRKAQALQQSQAPAVQYKRFGDIDRVIAPGPLSGVAAALNRGMGGLQEDQATRRNVDLGRQQSTEMEDYQRQLMGVPNQTKRVLKKTLGPDGQPAIVAPGQPPAAPEYEDVSLNPLEQNAKRMDIAIGMSRLPKARGMANELFKQGIDFPEKYAAQQEKLAADADARAAALEEKARQFDISDETKRMLAEQANALRKEANDTRLMMGQMASSVAQQNADTNRARLDETKRKNEADQLLKNEKEQAKKDAAANDAQGAVDEIDQTISLIDTAIGKRDANGKLLPGQTPAKGFDKYVGTLTGGLQADYVRGSDAASYKTYDDQLKGSARIEGIRKMKGSGSISNAEGEAAQAAINGANAAADQPTYIHHMRVYRDILEKGKQRHARGVRVKPDGTEYRPGADVTAPTVSASDQELLDRYLPKGK